MIPAAWLLAALAAVVALVWVLLALRTLRLLRGYRVLEPLAGPLPDGLPPVDAIIPARNEEAHVAATVAAVLAQDHPALRAIVVDDRSTDRTGAILDDLASDPRIRDRLVVVHGAERPDGWVGKTWALRQGLDHARADWLWFVDADMGLHPRALATACAEAHQADADLVTLAPRGVAETFWQATIGLTLTQLLANLYPEPRINDPDRPDAMAVGGFILIRRQVYDQVGGHEAVRGEIVEDIALGRRVKQAGGRLRLRAAPGLVWTHLYGSLGDIWRGLRKNAYAGMGYQFHKYATGALGALVMAWTPPAALLLGMLALAAGRLPTPLAALLAGLGALGWLAQAAAALPYARFLRIRPAMALSLPLGLSLYVAIATASVWHHHRGRIIWKDAVFVPRNSPGPDPPRPASGPGGVPSRPDPLPAQAVSPGP